MHFLFSSTANKNSTICSSIENFLPFFYSHHVVFLSKQYVFLSRYYVYFFFYKLMSFITSYDISLIKNNKLLLIKRFLPSFSGLKSSLDVKKIGENHITKSILIYEQRRLKDDWEIKLQRRLKLGLVSRLVLFWICFKHFSLKI